MRQMRHKLDQSMIIWRVEPMARRKKLVVEVVEARDLLPKDGTGTSSPYVAVDFHGQRRRTQTAHRDLNPTWNELLLFDVAASGDQTLEVDVLHDRKVGRRSHRSNFLGRVRLDSRHLVTKGEEALIYFPLERKSFFTWVRGEIGLKVYYVADDEPAATAAISVPDLRPPPAVAPEAESSISQHDDQLKKANIVDGAEESAAIAPPADDQAPPPAAGAEVDPPQGEDHAATTASKQQEEGDDLPAAPSTEAEVDKEAPAQPQTPAEADKAPPAVVRQAPPSLAPERSSYDLVDKMHYLYVRVVRARLLPANSKPHVRVSVDASGRCVSTKSARKIANFWGWEQTFAFARDHRHHNSAGEPATLEVSVWDLPPESGDGDEDEDDEGKHFLGGVCFDVSEVAMREVPDSPLAPQWYRIEGGRARGGDLMLATWIGTQDDESFHDAWKADTPSSTTQHAVAAKVYQSPKLWYLRATVIEAQEAPSTARDLAGGGGVSVKAVLGFQTQRTRPSPRNGNGAAAAALSWNEDLIFVAAEPFGENQKLVFAVEIRSGKDVTVIGTAAVDLSSIERRVDDRKVAPRWLDLLSPPSDELPAKPKKRQKGGGGGGCGGRLHVRLCFDGGYHVADEPPHAASDYRPSARQLWSPPVGTVELGIVGCRGLLPMRTVEGRGATTNAFAVAKYGPKWARTRTVADSFDPAWNEQYTWDIHDPSTAITVAVFDMDSGGELPTCRSMGRIRIRVSTLESNRPYRGAYPLLLLLPSGVRKMGEIEIAVRFARSTPAIGLLQLYCRPMLPRMHHLHPIPAAQREQLRFAAARVVAGGLAQAEPPLPREVVLWMLEAEGKLGFSMRRVRANWRRIADGLRWAGEAARWVEDVRGWKHPAATVLVHAAVVLVAWRPGIVVPAAGVHTAAVAMWRWRRRPRGPAAQPCLRASGAEPPAIVDREELDEEFDGVPSGKGTEVVRARYERCRAVGARLQGLLGDVAAQVERTREVVSWRDPRATGIFVAFCLVVSAAMMVVPARLVAVAAGFYYLRHPMFRERTPSPALNFFRRLPSLSDRVL